MALGGLSLSMCWRWLWLDEGSCIDRAGGRRVKELEELEKGIGLGVGKAMGIH